MSAVLGRLWENSKFLSRQLEKIGMFFLFSSQFKLLDHHQISEEIITIKQIVSIVLTLGTCSFRSHSVDNSNSFVLYQVLAYQT